MFEKMEEVRARITCTNGKNEIRKFIPLDELPPIGMKIVGTKYFYGKSRPAELSKTQRTRDDDLHSKYDFYIVNAVDEAENQVGELYYCLPHKTSKTPTRTLYHTFLSKAREYDDIDKYVEDMMKSDIWVEEDVVRDGREGWLKTLYKASNTTIEKLVKSQGMTYASFCTYFGIPRRTVDNWVYIRQPPLYLLILFEESLGIISCE